MGNCALTANTSCTQRTREELYDKTAEILTGDLNLLSIICQTSFLGDAAAHVSVIIFEMLSRKGQSTAEAFLQRLVHEKMDAFLRNEDAVLVMYYETAP